MVVSRRPNSTSPTPGHLTPSPASDSGSPSNGKARGWRKTRDRADSPKRMVESKSVEALDGMQNGFTHSQEGRRREGHASGRGQGRASYSAKSRKIAPKATQRDQAAASARARKNWKKAGNMAIAMNRFERSGRERKERKRKMAAGSPSPSSRSATPMPGGSHNSAGRHFADAGNSTDQKGGMKNEKKGPTPRSKTASPVPQRFTPPPSKEEQR